MGFICVFYMLYLYARRNKEEEEKKRRGKERGGRRTRLARNQDKGAGGGLVVVVVVLLPKELCVGLHVSRRTSLDVLARERPCHGATAGRADEGGERRTSRMIMPCSRPQSMR